MEVDGVCALVGENGAGKTTALSIPSLLSTFRIDNPAGAFIAHGGLWGIVHLDAPEKIARLSVTIDGTRGELEIAGGKYIERLALESAGARFERNSVDQSLHRRQGADRAQIGSMSSRPIAADVLQHYGDESIARYAHVLDGYRCYSRYKLDQLRLTGSQQSSDVVLAPHGENVFALLRNWRDQSAFEERYDWVTSALRKSFFREFDRFDYSTAGNVVAAKVRRADKSFLELNGVSDGWFTMLLHLVAIASAPDGGVVAIDEPENALSPFAIRNLVEFAQDRARTHGVSVLFATHSPVLLNQFREDPSSIWIFDSEDKGSERPVKRLTDWKDEDWLGLFSLGDLYAREQVAAPRRAEDA